MNYKFNNKTPNTYEDWLNLGHVIIPTDQKKARVSWKKEDFSLTKEEWKNNHSKAQIALRLDKHIDLDIDNPIVGRFIQHYLKDCGAVYGRKNNPYSHYLWEGSCKFTQYILPKSFEKNFEKFEKGAVLCELRSGKERYTIVPESPYDDGGEIVEWANYTNIHKYSGNIKIDVGKIALSAALTIIYPSKGSRDTYCTAIAGTLIRNTDWTTDEIDEFISNISEAANDPEIGKRKKKGTTVKKAEKQYGIPKLAETLNVDQKDIVKLFSWVGVKYAAGGEIAQEAIGDIIEYGHDRYEVKVNAFVDGVLNEKVIRVDGPTLMNQKAFYDAVISKASVWIPKMKAADFETIMKQKFEARDQSKDYDEEADEDLVFIKYFSEYIKKEQAFTDRINLLEYKRPHFDMTRKFLDFNLNSFENFLNEKRIKIKRVDLVMNIQKILKAKKYRGKVKNRSCVSWRIDNYDIPKEDLVIDGEITEEVKEITDES